MRRRHVATLVAAAFLFAIVGPAAAGEHDASAQPEPVAAVEPSVEAGSEPSEPTPSTEPTEPTEPAADPTEPVAEPAELTADQATPGPAAAPGAAQKSAAQTGALDAAGRWIVIYRAGTNVKTTSERQQARIGFKADRVFRNTVRGFAARLSSAQVKTLRADPSVKAVVPDEIIEVAAQSYPTGIDRIGARLSAAAKIDGIDQRIDADVAIVDTGISLNADLNVVGGYNCSTTNRALWRDVHGHGTHVAGTVGAIDNGDGVVGVAPGVRLWGVKILDDTGTGLLSWYVCGLDWIAAQRDPADASRPRFESVNMSVTKYGKDDQNCGATNADPLHAAICRLVASGVTVVAAAANDSASAAARVPAAYNEVITVSALADTDGKAGGLGGNRCYSWGGYDSDDTFADFSNFGSDVDIIAPGKCIWSTIPGGFQYMSGTSMAAPHVTGAAALLKESRPELTPAEVKEALQYLGNLNWKITSDPDPYHEKLLDVSRVDSRGDFSVAVGSAGAVSGAGGTRQYAVTLTRTPTSFERIVLRAVGVPSGFGVTFSPSSVYGFSGLASTMSVTVPRSTAPGTYQFTVTGTEHSIVHQATATVEVQNIPPVAAAPSAVPQPKGVLGRTTLPVLINWPAAVDDAGIAGYELQTRVDGGAWGATVSLLGTARQTFASQSIGHLYQYRMRARDGFGAWSAWAEGAAGRSGVVQESFSAVRYAGTWTRYAYPGASGGTERYATRTGASAKTTFTGRAVAIVGHAGPTRGSVRIYVDGVYRITVSFYRATSMSRQIAYVFAWSAVGTHTIEIRLARDRRVDLDAFVIYR